MPHLDGTHGADSPITAFTADADIARQFLSQVSRVLAECLDYEGTLAAISSMAFPYPGSWCIIDTVESDGSLRRVDVVHPDPVKQEHARRLVNGWPPQRFDQANSAPAVRAAHADAIELIEHVSDKLLATVATSQANLRDLRALEIGSVLIVPLVARGHMLGTITFITTAGKRSYTEADIAPAQDLAAHCAITLDNARLFRDVEHARATAAELNQQLIISSIRMQELAEEARDANQTKSRFLATMSHEIRTPINAIVGYTDLLDIEVAGPLTTEQKAYVARIQASSRHLIGLIDDILDLAKVEAGRTMLKRNRLPAAEAIGAALSLVEPQASDAGVAVDCRCDDLSVAYIGDGDRVRQVLVILLSNAVKFTPRGGRVSVSYGVVTGPVAEADLSEPGPWVHLEVADTGIGISEQDAAIVFEPFMQIDQQNTRKKGGSGLGLAIGLELARRMGGNLTLRTALGEGSRFTLWLPAADGDD